MKQINELASWVFTPILVGSLLVGCGKAGTADSTDAADVPLHAAAYATEPLGSATTVATTASDLVSPQPSDPSTVAGLKAQLKALLPEIKTACKPVVEELIKNGTIARGNIRPAGRPKKIGALAKALVKLGDQVPEPCRGYIQKVQAIRSSIHKAKNGPTSVDSQA